MVTRLISFGFTFYMLFIYLRDEQASRIATVIDYRFLNLAKEISDATRK